VLKLCFVPALYAACMRVPRRAVVARRRAAVVAGAGKAAAQLQPGD